MEYKQHIMLAIRFIEENLRDKIVLADCARAAGYSEYHFLRIFKETTGLTPVNYIRKRRLTEIIKHIQPDVTISETAFTYGFNSKENFTRAFVAEHHILPTEYKSTLNSLKLYQPLQIEAVAFEIVPKMIQLNPFILTVYKSENSPPNFWNKYNSSKWSRILSGGKVCMDYGVSLLDAKENKLDYFIGIRKENAQGDTTGTMELCIEGGQYAVFTTPTASHHDFVNTIHRTWEYIKCTWLPDSGYYLTNGYEFETYVEESRTFSEKIYIPVNKTERND